MLLTKSYSSSARTFFGGYNKNFVRACIFFLSLNEDNYEVSLKSLYKMFKDTKSHGLVSLQFLGALNIFFWWRR